MMIKYNLIRSEIQVKDNHWNGLLMWMCQYPAIWISYLFMEKMYKFVIALCNIVIKGRYSFQWIMLDLIFTVCVTELACTLYNIISYIGVVHKYMHILYFRKKYTLNSCFVVFCCGSVTNVFNRILQGCFTGTGAIIGLPQCQWSNPEGYGLIYHISPLGVVNLIAAIQSKTKLCAYFKKHIVCII